MKENLAKIIRILTIPPFMVSILLLIIYLNPRNVFIDKFNLLSYSYLIIYYKQIYQCPCKWTFICFVWSYDFNMLFWRY